MAVPLSSAQPGVGFTVSTGTVTVVPSDSAATYDIVTAPVEYTDCANALKRKVSPAAAGTRFEVAPAPAPVRSRDLVPAARGGYAAAEAEPNRVHTPVDS